MKKDPGKVELTEEQLEELKDKIKASNLDSSSQNLVLNSLQAMLWLSKMLEAKKLSMKKLARLFGWRTEKLKKKKSDDDPKPPRSGGGKPSGKGRSGKDEYSGAKREFHRHPELSSGDRCPSCGKGNLYNLDPGSFISIKGSTPLVATIHEREKLRCSGCGEIFTAPLTGDLREQKWDESADAMIALLKYATGTPFHRLGRLQKSLGVPLAASTQWERVEQIANSLFPLYKELIKEAAKGDLAFIDDTANKILDFLPNSKRTGIFTTGVVSKKEEREIILYFTGNRHAGENLEEILKLRPEEMPLMIQMSDALSRNIPKTKTHESFCHAHARRNFKDVHQDRKKEVDFVLHLYGKLFKLEKSIKERKLDDKRRLELHQRHSSKVLSRLRRWCLKCFYLKKVDPQEGLGQAIKYLLTHWERLTLFLRVAGVPLENNTAERALKARILERKNSYFYKTLTGAKVGDVISSIIQSAVRAKINPFQYLTSLHRYKDQVRKAPQAFLPWNVTRNELFQAVLS